MNKFFRPPMQKLSVLFAKSFSKSSGSPLIRFSPTCTDGKARWRNTESAIWSGYSGSRDCCSNCLVWRWLAMDTAESECPIASGRELRRRTKSCLRLD